MRPITQYKFLIYLYTCTHVYMSYRIFVKFFIIKYYICEYMFQKNLNIICYKDYILETNLEKNNSFFTLEKKLN